MIVKLNKKHIDKIDNNFIEQNWGSRKVILEKYLIEQQNNERIVIVDEIDDDCTGYITLVINQNSGPFKDTSIPEIVDFNVFEKYQKNGIGQKLLTAVIDKAKEFSDKVGIGVGLNSNYGKAQRLYVKNGFIPNGTGIYYEGKVLPVNEKCINNDELALYFIKEIK